jgi:putative transport protein
MVDFLADNPLFLLFAVVAIGYPLGRIRLAGTGLGVASVLFAGLAVGAVDPSLRLPEIVYQLGLVLFVYTVGLSNGRGFFASFRRQGVGLALWVLGTLGLGAGLIVAAWSVLDLSGPDAAGLFAGSLTNTPALAGVLDYLEEHAAAAEREALLVEPVVAYSLAYPMAVVGTIAAIVVAQRLWRIDYAVEAARARDRQAADVGRKLASRTIRVTNQAVGDESIHALGREHGWEVVFGRLKRDGVLTLVTGTARLQPGDLVTAIGEESDLERATAYLGEPSEEQIELDREQLDYRRVFLSNPRVAGARLRDLDLPQQFGAIVTRVRRGDVEFLPDGDTVLELGDRVRVVAGRRQIEAVVRFFGDSYRALSEIDVLTFSLGIAAGLALGAIPIPLPGGTTIELGLAGGPLVVALLLGAKDRTGPFVWTLPYGANLTLRQIGLILFLAGIGTRAGYAFRSEFGDAHGLVLFATGAVVSCVVALTALWSSRALLKIPMGIATGMLGGLQTQPAVLSFALEQSRDELPNVGYASVYPLATIAKIVIAQVMIALLT